MRPTIKVVGLNDFRKGLRGIDRGLPKTVRLVLNEAATAVVEGVRPSIPRRTGAAAASLKPQSTQTTARVAVGGPRAPYYPWLDFGGAVGPNDATVRPFYSDGRYIFPWLSDNRPAVEAVMLEGLARLASGNGIEVD